MVGSTRMSTKLAPDFLSRIVTVFSQEVSYAIERCHGLVLKFNGDAVISYFPPSSSALNDLNRVILCEATFYVVKHAINHCFYKWATMELMLKLPLTLDSTQFLGMDLTIRGRM